MYQVVSEGIAQLKPFFAVAPTNAPMLEAFLDGRAPGRAFVDDFRAPSACVVAMQYNFVFFGGEVTPHFFEEALRRLRREQALHVVWSEERHRRPRTPRPSEEVDRLEYRQRVDPGRARLRAVRLATAGADVRRIDEALLERCQWREEIARATGSVRNFMGHGIGFCLLVGDAVVAEAYACFWGAHRVEIATTTHPDHRGRGHATTVCAHLIETCEEIGFETYWSCDADNEPSQRLADRLGYVEPRAYRLLRYAQDPPAAAT